MGEAEQREKGGRPESRLFPAGASVPSLLRDVQRPWKEAPEGSRTLRTTQLQKKRLSWRRPPHAVLCCVCVCAVSIACMVFTMLNLIVYMTIARGLPGGASAKESTCQCRRCKRLESSSIPESGRSPWSRKCQPAPVFLPGEFKTEEPGGLQSLGLQRARHN